MKQIKNKMLMILIFYNKTNSILNKIQILKIEKFYKKIKQYY